MPSTLNPVFLYFLQMKLMVHIISPSLSILQVQEFKQRFQSVAPAIKRKEPELGEDVIAELKTDILGDSER